MNSPWECPRCKRINAPFNPTCFCSGNSELSEQEQGILNQLKTPKYSFGQTEHAINNSRCTNCGSYHGMFQGRAVQCVDLQSAIVGGYCNGVPVTL